MLYWGVIPLLAPRTDNTDEMIASAVEAAKGQGLVNRDDTRSFMPENNFVTSSGQLALCGV